MKRWIVFVTAIAALTPGAGAQQYQRRATMVGGGDRDHGKCTVEVVVDGAADIQIREVAGMPHRLPDSDPAGQVRFGSPGSQFHGIGQSPFHSASDSVDIPEQHKKRSLAENSLTSILSSGCAIRLTRQCSGALADAGITVAPITESSRVVRLRSSLHAPTGLRLDASAACPPTARCLPVSYRAPPNK